MEEKGSSDREKWQAFLDSRGRKVEFVWMRFMPLHGAFLARMYPVQTFTNMINNGKRWGLPECAAISLMRNDHIAEGGSVCGALYLEPDIESSFTISDSDQGANRVEMFTKIMSPNGSPAKVCTRHKVQLLSQLVASKFGYTLLFGFEVEVVFMRKNEKDGCLTQAVQNHSWATATSDVKSMLPLVEDIVRKLLEMNIGLEQYHAESAPGQWEFALPPMPPLHAVDNLVKAREVIQTVANRYGLRATMHPRPFPDHAGTGAHIHISVNSVAPTDQSNSHSESFFAGIMEHLPALTAFNLPLDISYQRVEAGLYSGGEYVAWGWENKEAALRRVANNRFEFKMMCGTANPYVAVAGILAAGIDGLQRRIPLTAGDCFKAPTDLTEAERTKIGVIEKIPQSVEASIQKLASDSRLSEILGEEYVNSYIFMTKSWNHDLREMDAATLRHYLLENY